MSSTYSFTIELDSKCGCGKSLSDVRLELDGDAGEPPPVALTVNISCPNCGVGFETPVLADQWAVE